MKDNKRKLDDLIVEVMEQMQKRKYGEKISSHYRSSFSNLKSISEDIGEEYLSEKLIESFLDSPVGCSEKWSKKERSHMANLTKNGRHGRDTKERTNVRKQNDTA